MSSNYKKIGDYIKLVDVRNKKLAVDTLLGLSISKEFIPSVANTIGTSMANYKIIKKGQFACSLMQVRRDKRIPVALQNDFDKAIISQAYPVFEVIDSESLDPEYLMMWMSRTEFDRHACFLAVGGVRGSLEWDDFCDMELPVPSIEKQCEIVREYNVVIDRITLNEKLTKKLEDTAQAIYKQWFVDFEFPLSKEYAESIGKPELENQIHSPKDKTLPEHWSIKNLSEISDVKGGKRLPKGEVLSDFETPFPYVTVRDMKPIKALVLDENFRYVPESIQPKISRYIVKEGDLILAIVGATIGKVNIIHSSLSAANLTENCVKITNFIQLSTSYIYHYFRSETGMQEIQKRIVGGAQGKLPIYNVESINVVIPDSSTFDYFIRTITPLEELSKLKVSEIVKLNMLKGLMLTKMVSV